VAILAVVWAFALPAPSRAYAQRPHASGTTPARDPAAWPREARRAGGSVLMYQPQIEPLTENEIEARAAVQITVMGKEPAFGAVWLSADFDVDREARLLTFRSIEVPRVRLVDASDADKARSRALEAEIPRWNLEMDLDRFIPLLDLAEHDNPVDPGLKHDPPRIVIAREPTILVVLDGHARRQPLTTPTEAAQQKLERVVNTPAVIVYQPGPRTYYLAGGGDLWYSATDVAGPYEPAKSVPAAIAGSEGSDSASRAPGDTPTTAAC
jgi:hypothetical protein